METRGAIVIILLLICAAANMGCCTPYFALDTEVRWQDALSTVKVSEITPLEWNSYMNQWNLYLEEGDPYPTNTFCPPDLYVYGGGGGGGLDPEEPGLVMAWGDETMPAGSYSSAWKYDYQLDPNLTNAIITISVVAPQFNPAGNQINNVSFGIQDTAGNIRSWQWGVGPGMPIQWATPTTITIIPSITSVTAAIPNASGFANNPAFSLANSQVFIADENAIWVGGASQIPPPGQTISRIWNYWYNLVVTANGSQFDWGDAPDPTYPTLSATNGACHVISNLFLGTLIDAEANGQPNAAATGDDIANLADEDGVVFTSPLIPGQMASITVTASAAGMLDAWIDFAGDGSWAQTGDQICTNAPLTAGVNAIAFTVPATAAPGTLTYARFRLSSAGNQSYIGMAMDGEVEDYQVVISQEEDSYDWGDAPDSPYPTLAASNGANHKIALGMFLGASVDSEINGQPDPKALGDDNNGVPDDEDGVVFNNLLLPGGIANITVSASTPGLLDAWVDFNGNGSWGDPGEQIFTNTPLVAGANNLTFAVPTGISAGTVTFSRFRYSSTGGLSYTGPASDGEVEDYQVRIGYKWIQHPDLTETGIDVNATEPYILADDFQCTTTGPITDIHVWGSWYHDLLPLEDPMQVKFRLSIHADIPANESPTGYSMPGEVLWYREFTPGQFVVKQYAGDINEGWMEPPEVYEFPGDHVCWEYDFYITDDPFIQRGTEEEPVVYWLDVQAEPLDGAAFFGWKTSLEHWNDDAVWGQGYEPYLGPWNELIYPPLHQLHPESIDLAFAITGEASPEPGNLVINPNIAIADHFWWPSSDPDNEMISIIVGADPTEDIMWNTILLQASGSGNDAADISAVNVWLDNDNDAKVSPADTLIGTGTYPTDNGIAAISLSSPQLILAGTSVNVVISYTMSAAASLGSTYQFDVSGAKGMGQISGLPVGVIISPSPLLSARKIVGLPPITIGEAKKLPVGTQFMLLDKEITADFLPPTWPSPWTWFYIEEPTRASGIGVIGGLTGPLNIGDKVSLTGIATLVNSAELMISPIDILVTSGTPSVMPVGMNNKWTGGGAFGEQPGVIDNAWTSPTTPSYGLNSVGKLIRTWGTVTGYGGITLDGTNMVDVFWMDDGSALADGYLTTAGAQSLGIAVVTPNGIPASPTGYWGVTGIMRTILNPAGDVVRLLVPRDYANDMTDFTPSP